MMMMMKLMQVLSNESSMLYAFTKYFLSTLRFVGGLLRYIHMGTRVLISGSRVQPMHRAILLPVGDVSGA